MLDKLSEYLNARGIELIRRQKPVEITESSEDIARVAGAWTSNADEIRLVVQARCDLLRERLITSDMPFEIPVTRQCLLEVAGILEDFELIHDEFMKRDSKGEYNTEQTPK